MKRKKAELEAKRICFIFKNSYINKNLKITTLQFNAWNKKNQIKILDRYECLPIISIFKNSNVVGSSSAQTNSCCTLFLFMNNNFVLICNSFDFWQQNRDIRIKINSIKKPSFVILARHHNSFWIWVNWECIFIELYLIHLAF